MSKDVFVCFLLLQDGTSWCHLCAACALPVHCGAELKLVFVCHRRMMRPDDRRRVDLLQRQEAYEEREKVYVRISAAGLLETMLV